MKISVCLIVKNEENNLARALRSVPDSFEIVVVDTGSTDRSVPIAQQFGAVTASYEWSDDFAAARNFAGSRATGDYILALDADEELPADTEEQLLRFVQQHPGKAGCVYINNVTGEEIRRHRMVRFYPNRPEFRFAGTVHEQVYENGEPAVFEILPLQVMHYGYEENEYEVKSKFERYLPLYEKHLADHPNDGYMLYQMGKLYYSIEDWAGAERHLLLSMEQRQLDRLYYPVMLVMLGYVLKEQQRYAEAEQLLYPYVELYPDFPDLFFLLGLLAMDTGKIQAVESYFAEALKIGDTDKYTSVYGVGTFLAAYNLGVYYEVTGNKDLAGQCYRFAAEYEYEPALRRLK
ncbi:glycosyltransferase [Cohnella candidum]|uniref:Glycosyltransferase n=1 Tax=Cohnella candidum TaxID=2674991 RepID=A0A3G3K259_9BACL|nr:glycosyltransferase [Cohnella candidum]AYQ74137.1 glycosyltransferase [Cohnella candidum]